MTIDEHSLRREVTLSVDRERAWASIAEPGELSAWLADEVNLELQPGARGALRWRTGEERHAVVEEVEEGRRLVLRWWVQDGDPSLVELTLDDVAGGTRLTVTEIPLAVLDLVGIELLGWLPSTRGPQLVARGCV